MIRAAFAIRLDGACLPAPNAQWFADREAARASARTVVRGLVSRHAAKPRLREAVMVVTGDDGAILLEMPFRDALYMPVRPVAEPDRRRSVPAPAKPGATVEAALRPIRRLAGALVGRRHVPIGR